MFDDVVWRIPIFGVHSASELSPKENNAAWRVVL